jgi:hemolysin III
MALKLVWPRRFERAAMALYLTMGWSGLFAVGPLAHALTPLALALIVAGGGLYSAGVVFHMWDDLRFHNAIWHCFVLVAAACHYSAVLISLS